MITYCNNGHVKIIRNDARSRQRAVGKTRYSGSHSDAVQRYITRCRGTACRAPTGVPYINENCYNVIRN
jgi:hypothetical protein